MSKNIIKYLVIIAIVGGLAFYGGVRYGQGSGANSRGTQTARGNFGPLGAAGARNGVNLTAGTILSVEKDSAVIKLRDGGSKIIRLAGSTEIMKTATGTPADLLIGQTVTVNGTNNTDGSLTAQSIQLRPGLAGGR